MTAGYGFVNAAERWDGARAEIGHEIRDFVLSLFATFRIDPNKWYGQMAWRSKSVPTHSGFDSGSPLATGIQQYSPTPSWAADDIGRSHDSPFEAYRSTLRRRLRCGAHRCDKCVTRDQGANPLDPKSIEGNSTGRRAGGRSAHRKARRPTTF